MLQRWHTVSDLTGPRFKPPTCRSKDERVTTRLTGRLRVFVPADNTAPYQEMLQRWHTVRFDRAEI